MSHIELASPCLPRMSLLCTDLHLSLWYIGTMNMLKRLENGNGKCIFNVLIEKVIFKRLKNANGEGD